MLYAQSNPPEMSPSSLWEQNDWVLGKGRVWESSWVPENQRVRESLSSISSFLGANRCPSQACIHLSHVPGVMGLRKQPWSCWLSA